MIICQNQLFVFCVTGPDANALGGELKAEVSYYRSMNFAENTKKTYRTHLNSYLQFCDQLNILPVPASEENIAKYAAFLARRLKPSSIKQYLNIIRVLHLECGKEHPYKDSWVVKTTLNGIEKSKGCKIVKKTPIDPNVLLFIRSKLDLSLKEDAVFWAACLVMFFGLLRKSNLFPDCRRFDIKRQLTRENIEITDDSVILRLLWSKTIQRQEKVFIIKLPYLRDHSLCPVSAVMNMYQVLGPKSKLSQAFPITGEYFNRHLREITTSIGDFSSHSFRRGGAIWGMSCGVPGEIIRIMGDWASTCYLQYLDQIPLKTLDRYRLMFGQKLPSK